MGRANGSSAARHSYSGCYGRLRAAALLSGYEEARNGDLPHIGAVFIARDVETEKVIGFAAIGVVLYNTRMDDVWSSSWRVCSNFVAMRFRFYHHFVLHFVRSVRSLAHVHELYTMLSLSGELAGYILKSSFFVVDSGFQHRSLSGDVTM